MYDYSVYAGTKVDDAKSRLTHRKFRTADSQEQKMRAGNMISNKTGKTLETVTALQQTSLNDVMRVCLHRKKITAVSNN